MARFKLGDRVRIVSPTDSPFAGSNAVIEDVKPNERRLVSLDSYTVLFAWGERQTFWDAQLEPFAARSTNPDV